MKKVVVGIISNSEKEKKYLLMSSNNNFGAFTGFYYPPGGHIDNDEDKKTALIREIKEELGLEAVPVKEIAETEGDVSDQTTYWWLCETIDNPPMKIDAKEVRDVIWLTRNQILSSKNIWPATQNFFRNFIKD